DRTILPFEPGITGVVGPNGCGKSNIVDAIQWVMGEQSAKHLRGDSMADVIFNGSENRAATSMAEVSLVMDASGVNLPPHLIPIAKGDELAITRRLFRDGTAEYLINKTPVRLKDVHEVFMDTGVGRRAYSIIEQGQIDRMINVKPDDRRGIFEEVAGITKYKTKRREAERKLEGTRLNIERVDDIIRELDKQIRSLKIQATRARKYKEIKGELEKVDLFLLGRKLFSLQETLSTLQDQRLKLREARSALETEYSRHEAESSELDVKRVDQERLSQAVEVQEREFTLKVQKLENQLALFQQEQQHLVQAEQGRTQECEELSNKLVESERETEALSEELQGIGSALFSSREGIEARQNELTEVQARLIDGEKERSRAQKELSQATEKSIYLENQLEHGRQKESEFCARNEALGERLTQAVTALDSSKNAVIEADERVAECQERGQRVEKEVSELYQECQQISSNLSEAEDELFQTREKFHGIRSRLESLKELQENLEGYSPTAKEVLLKMDVEGALPLAEALQPDSDVEELVEVLLGESSNTVVVQSAQT
ncbi:MAG: AAA family ATPase, partial [Bdellovibrionales bacterium]|nr:AAA family ATPase [Bdellovibrionales bacterium]